MKIIIFSHPVFMKSQSMPRYAQSLAAGLMEKGHQVQTWSPTPFFYNCPAPSKLKKWFGYLDQYFVFPAWARKQIRKQDVDTLYVFADHALGPWVPLVSGKPHVIHCHDFLAQNGALDRIAGYSLGFTGKKYQRYIRKGYCQGSNFISISAKTKNDLESLLWKTPVFSAVIYNSFTRKLNKYERKYATEKLKELIHVNTRSGFVLHIGGNQWYKNRKGVIEIYDAWRELGNISLPLILIGERPVESLVDRYKLSIYKEDIHFIIDADDHIVELAYCSASVFLFPSLDEGFGLPIAEAMRLDCPVITTDAEPMREAAGNAALLIPRMPIGDNVALKNWAEEAAEKLDKLIQLSKEDRDILSKNAFRNAERFERETVFHQIENAYEKILFPS